MPTIIARLILSIVVMLLGPVLFTTLVIVVDHLRRGAGEEGVFLWCACATAAALTIVWLVLWFGGVNWTPWRAVKTIIAFAAATLIALGVGLSFLVLIRYGHLATASIISAMVWGLCWFGFTPIAWMETRDERTRRRSRRYSVNCPACGYNLTGLREAKCPECGASYTVDQLVAAVLDARSPLGDDAAAP